MTAVSLPFPTASVYASSKAAVSCFTEALHHNLVSEETQLRASVFYPSGGLLRTGLFTASRNRPEHLARVGEATGRKSMTFEEMKGMLAAAGRDVTEADLDALGDFVVAETAARRFIITMDLRDTVDLLHRRGKRHRRPERSTPPRYARLRTGPARRSLQGFGPAGFRACRVSGLQGFGVLQGVGASQGLATGCRGATGPRYRVFWGGSRNGAQSARRTSLHRSWCLRRRGCCDR